MGSEMTTELLYTYMVFDSEKSYKTSRVLALSLLHTNVPGIHRVNKQTKSNSLPWHPEALHCSICCLFTFVVCKCWMLSNKPQVSRITDYQIHLAH